MKNHFTTFQSARVAFATVTALLLGVSAYAQTGRTMNASEESVRFTNPISVMPVHGPCGRVNMLTTIRITDTEATLSWNPASTADSFRVVCTQISNGTVNSRTINGVHHTVSFTGLMPTEQYKWFVAAYCAGSQVSSGSVKFTTLSTARLQTGPSRSPGLAPICPGLGTVQIPDVGHDKAIIDWTSHATFDSIHVRFNATGSLITKTITITGNPANSRYILNGLSELTQYDVTLSSFCSNGVQSAWSNTLSFVTLRAPGPRIQNTSKNFHTSIVPNPATSYAKLMMESDANQFVQVDIYDITGKERYSRQMVTSGAATELELDLTTLPKGIYLVKTQSGSQSNVQRLIIN
jgi:hypothetical protein